MDVRRVHPEEDENDIAAEQVRDLLGRVPCRNAAAPLFVFDAGYVPVKLQRGLDELPLQLLVRLHSNRVFYADPETPEKRPVGRPYRHGAKFDFHDPETWPDPTHEHHCETEDKRGKYNAGKRPSEHGISENGFLTDHGGSIALNVFELERMDEEAVSLNYLRAA